MYTVNKDNIVKNQKYVGASIKCRRFSCETLIDPVRGNLTLIGSVIKKTIKPCEKACC